MYSFERGENINKKYTLLTSVGTVFVVVSLVTFLLEENGITQGVLEPFYPVSIVFLAIGIYISTPIMRIREAYDLLVNNEEHMEKFLTKAKKKWKEKLNEWFS